MDLDDHASLPSAGDSDEETLSAASMESYGEEGYDVPPVAFSDEETLSAASMYDSAEESLILAEQSDENTLSALPTGDSGEDSRSLPSVDDSEEEETYDHALMPPVNDHDYAQTSD